jgi:hypothetical protein
MDNHGQLTASDGFEQFAAASADFLSSCDIGLLNLVAARGLPATESLDIAACLDKLDKVLAKKMFEEAGFTVIVKEDNKDITKAKCP